MLWFLAYQHMSLVGQDAAVVDLCLKQGYENTTIEYRSPDAMEAVDPPRGRSARRPAPGTRRRQ